jgi:hypothetical protein
LTGAVIRSSKATTVRYERERPGELVHMDVKKLGRIPDGGGWRAHGRAAVGAGRDRTGKTGFDYVHSLVDDHSRLAYSEVLSDEKGEGCSRSARQCVCGSVLIHCFNPFAISTSALPDHGLRRRRPVPPTRAAYGGESCVGATECVFPCSSSACPTRPAGTTTR